MRTANTFDALVTKAGLAVGLLGTDDRDLLLAFAAAQLVPGRPYRESEVNEILRTWLAGPGAMLHTDHVELRRWLVDAAFVSRDGFGRRYVHDAQRSAAALVALGDVDGEALNLRAESARAEARSARAERRRRFEASH